MNAKPTEMKCEYMHKENHECSFACTLLWATNTMQLGLCIWNKHKTCGCACATAQNLGLCICNKHKAVGVVYLQQAQGLGLCICSKHKAWGCAPAQHKAWGCLFARCTKLDRHICQKSLNTQALCEQAILTIVAKEFCCATRNAQSLASHVK